MPVEPVTPGVFEETHPEMHSGAVGIPTAPPSAATVRCALLHSHVGHDPGAKTISRVHLHRARRLPSDRGLAIVRPAWINRDDRRAIGVGVENLQATIVRRLVNGYRDDVTVAIPVCDGDDSLL